MAAFLLKISLYNSIFWGHNYGMLLNRYVTGLYKICLSCKVNQSRFLIKKIPGILTKTFTHGANVLDDLIQMIVMGISIRNK